LLGRSRHQVDLGDEDLVLDDVLDHAPDERRLAVAARREHDDVLAVEDVARELADLVLAIRERLVQGESSVAEGVHGPSVTTMTLTCVTHLCVNYGWSCRLRPSARRRGRRQT